MRHSSKETMMLHMQAESTFGPRESGALMAEAFRPGGAATLWPVEEPAKTPWLKPGR